MASLITLLRKKLIACEFCYVSYTQLKYKIQSFVQLRYFLYDIKNTWENMYWGNETLMHPTQLQAKLLFYYHKIEKGLCMPGQRRFFGIEIIPQVIRLLTVWEANGNSKNDLIYIGAINSLRSYKKKFISQKKIASNPETLKIVSNFLDLRETTPSTAPTPITITKTQIESTIAFDDFKKLCVMRRSARNFDSTKVPRELIEQAISLAQLSPSACNRQPCKVYTIENGDLKKKLLSYQNGNAGFGHLAPIIFVVTSNSNHFFGAIERNQPYVDGGLFSMSLLLALQTQGIVSCCLNWCVTPSADSAIHALLSIPNSERIIMFIAAGFPVDTTTVPKSHRKATSSALVFQ